MGHSVRLTTQAYDEIDSIVVYIAQDSIEAARRWRDAILNEIASLALFPLRHGLAPEAAAINVDVRQMMCGVYRILYSVDEAVVTILGVRHGARRLLRPDELPGPP